MSRVAYLLSFDRVVEDGAHGADVKCDPDGGNIITAPHFADPGDDSAPLPGDYVALDESSGSGGEHATGYADVRNAGKAGPGEKRLYARKADGSPIVELWLKADGSVVIENDMGTFELKPNGDIDIKSSGDVVIKGGTIALNGVTIGRDGTIETAGDMVVKGLSFSQHVHLSAAPGSATGPATAVPKPPGP